MNLLGNHSCKLSSLSKEICAHCDCGTWTIWPQVAECESIGMTPSSKLGIHSWHPPRAPTQHPSQQNLKQVLSSKSKNKWHDVLVGCVSVCVCVWYDHGASNAVPNCSAVPEGPRGSILAGQEAFGFALMFCFQIAASNDEPKYLL